jgi:H+/gluconate symporter-like permease
MALQMIVYLIAVGFSIAVLLTQNTTYCVIAFTFAYILAVIIGWSGIWEKKRYEIEESYMALIHEKKRKKKQRMMAADRALIPTLIILLSIAGSIAFKGLDAYTVMIFKNFKNAHEYIQYLERLVVPFIIIIVPAVLLLSGSGIIRRKLVDVRELDGEQRIANS